MAGGPATLHENQHITVTRHGAREDVWWNVGSSPIRDDSGVCGVLIICSDVSEQHRANAASERLSQRLMEEIARREQSEQNHTLQLQIADALRGLTESDAIAKAAFNLLSAFLPVSQIDYADVDSGGVLFVIRHSWELNGVPSLCGVGGEIDAYGPAVVEALRAGQVVTIADVLDDPRTAAHTAAYASLRSRACMLVPVIKDGALVAILTLHQAAPCPWPQGHVPLVRDIAERIWHAIAHADAQERQGSDSAERHLAKEALDVSRERLSEGMVAARMALWDWDLATEQITFSQNTAEVFGGTWSSIGDVWKSVCEEDLERLSRAGEAAEATCGSYEEVVRIKRAGVDQPLWLQIHGKFIADESGVPRTVRSVAIDVTGLENAQKALQDADLRKDEFLAMLAHELRNPLAPIRAAAQLLGMAHGDGAQVQRMGAVIARQADHMTSLINDLLDVSRVTSGLVTLDKSPQDIWSIVGEAIEQVMPIMQERVHQLALDNGAPPLIVMGDRKRLVQILANLLHNAAKYTPANGHIKVALSILGAEVAISVRDDGVGMNADLLAHVFEPFSQEKRASDRSQGGLGLGLALVQRLVALHGGRVVAESEGAGCGAAFTVFLPALATQANVTIVAALGSGPAAVAPLRMMIVDDNADAANTLGMWLETFGHHVRVEYSAKAVLEDAASSHYDVYVLDIGLPGLDGNELARQLRQFPQNADATLIANTGYGGEYDKAEAMASGFDHYLVKPLSLATLESLLASLTHRAAPLLAAQPPHLSRHEAGHVLFPGPPSACHRPVSLATLNY